MLSRLRAVHLTTAGFRPHFRQLSATLSSFPRRNGTAAVSWEGSESADLVVDFVSDASSLPQGSLSTLSADFTEASKGATFLVPGTKQRRLIVKVTGDKLEAGDVRSGASAAIAAASKIKTVKSVAFNVSDEKLSADAKAAVVQAALLSNYHFDAFLSDESKEKRARTLPQLVFPGGRALEPVAVKCQATLFARDVANQRADVMNPQAFEDVARSIAAEHGMEITVIAGDDLRDSGLAMFHAVGKAAQVPPRLICLKYKGAPVNTTTPVALVGKGICFDSGGLNLKPTGSIETMHYDKGGAAAVLGAADAIGKLKLKTNAVFALAVAENAIDSAAYKPHEIIKSLMGPTVEVRNTDAEGRLLLADAMWYVQQRFKPSTLIDVATLTGACVVGLGEYVAGLFSNDDALAQQFTELGKKVNERVWRLPILPEHTAELDNPHADIASTGAGRTGGACTAAAFLQKFVDKGVKWAHLDIAGPGMYSKARGEMCAGATGFGARLLVELLEAQAQHAASSTAATPADVSTPPKPANPSIW